MSLLEMEVISVLHKRTRMVVPVSRVVPSWISQANVCAWIERTVDVTVTNMAYCMLRCRMLNYHATVMPKVAVIIS